MLVSIIVPAYKKEKTIIDDIKNIDNVMSHTRWDYEIIVVVDGFLDKTYEIAKKIENFHIQIHGYKDNKGKGYAVRYGMSKAIGDYISFIDAGMEIDANGISMLLEHLVWYDADIIVGSKRHPASKVLYTKLRRIYSFFYQLLIFFLFRLKVRDTQVGLKVYKREVLEKVLPRLVVKEFAFDIEILSVAYRLGYRKIYEAPVQINFDLDQSTFNKFRPLFLDPYIRKMIWDTMAIFYRMNILRYYDDKSKSKWKTDKELEIPPRVL